MGAARLFGRRLGLFVGTAGTALLLARLLDPARIASLSLLAF